MKILVVIATYGNANDKYLQRLVEEYRSMSFDIDLVVLSNVHKYVADGVEVIVIPRRWNPLTLRGTFNGKRNWRFIKQEYRDWVRHLDLPFAHRQVFADRLNDYDLFVYSENDTLVTEKNLRAFLSVLPVLQANEIPGFLRFEKGPDGDLNYPEVHGHFHWKSSSVRKRGDDTFAVFTNEHAACYVITREQLRRAINSGGFLVAPHGGKYDLLCTASTDIYTQCGFEKLICISQLDEFLIHHLPNKYVGTEFGVGDSEMRGQVERLLKIADNAGRSEQLFETETKLTERAYSKGYYEPVSQQLMSMLPSGVRTVLSIGSGWGAVEGCLAAKGLRVAAVPLDAVIPGHAEAEGIEIISGDFDQARRKLAGRRFDCLLLSNVLHLVSDPVKVLSSFGSLVSPGGVAIAVVPNTSRLKLSWAAVRGRHTEDPGMYRETGVQRTSRGTVRAWFESAGFRIQALKQKSGPLALRIGRLMLGMLDTWLADEFILTARKNAEAEAAPSGAALQQTAVQI